MKEVALQEFNGPLDLLLQLIEENELEITKIALAEVTEQFLQYLEQVEESKPEELADFLVVATKLLLLKSQAIMPYLQQEDEEDPGELAAQLRMYKKYLDAMTGIEMLLNSGAALYPRKQTKVERKTVFSPPPSATTETMKQFYEDALQRLEPVVRIPKAAMERVVSLREKLAQVGDTIKKRAQVSFRELLNDAGSRGEVVVTFLAVLELVKQHTVSVSQEGSNSELHITRIDEE